MAEGCGNLQLRIPADSSVGLGYLYDVRRGMGSFIMGLPISVKIVTQPLNFQQQNKDHTASSASRIMTILGEVEINVNFAAASIYGKAHCDLRNSEEKESAQLSFSNYAIKECQKIDITSIGPESFQGVNYEDYTHIVTAVYIGKFLYGDIKIKSKIASNSLNAAGELGLKISSIPIGGHGSLEFNKSDFDKEYQFSASLVAKGHELDKGLLSCGDLSSFLESVKLFETADASKSNVIVKVDMTPFSALKRLQSAKGLSFTATVVSDAKTIILNLIDLLKYFKEQLIPFVNSKRRADLVLEAQELQRTAKVMLGNVENALSECRTREQVAELNSLCDGAANYSVDMWINLPQAKKLNDFLLENVVSAAYV
jgi:hypothetical protein